MTRLYSLRLPLYFVAAVLAGLVAMAASPKPAEKPLWDILMPKGLDDFPDRPFFRALKNEYRWPDPPNPQDMVNSFGDLADRRGDTMYLIISHGRNCVYGWTTSGKKKLEQTVRQENAMTRLEQVSFFPYLKAIKTWDRNIISKFPYFIDDGPSMGKFFPGMIFRIIYKNGDMQFSKIYVNMDSVYVREANILLGSYEYGWSVLYN